YDPMIAKLIVYGEDRPAAIARLQHALEQSAVLGVTTNVSLLHAISQHPAFSAGNTSTSFLEEYDLLTTEAAPDLPDTALIAAALYDISTRSNDAVRQDPLWWSGVRATSNHGSPSSLANNTNTSHNPWQTLGPWRMI